jgi:hypothetical protein
MTRAGLIVFFASRASEHTIDSAELGVIEALFAGFLIRLVHGLGVGDVDHAHGLDLLGREQAKLDLLDGPERTFRLNGSARRHGGGSCGGSGGESEVVRWVDRPLLVADAFTVRAAAVARRAPPSWY